MNVDIYITDDEGCTIKLTEYEFSCLYVGRNVVLHNKRYVIKDKYDKTKRPALWLLPSVGIPFKLD